MCVSSRWLASLPKETVSKIVAVSADLSSGEGRGAKELRSVLDTVRSVCPPPPLCAREEKKRREKRRADAYALVFSCFSFFVLAGHSRRPRHTPDLSLVCVCVCVAQARGDVLIEGAWCVASRVPALPERRFDTIVCDYLLGSMDGFTPFEQNTLFAQLEPLLSDEGVVHIVGLALHQRPEIDHVHTLNFGKKCGF